MMKKIIILGSVFTGAFIFGQVGISTDNPSATLDIVSKGTDETTKALEINNSATPTPKEMVTVLNNNNVGIGVTNPLYNLEIGDFVNNGAYFSLSQTGNNVGGQTSLTYFTKRTNTNSLTNSSSKGWKWFALSDSYASNPALANSLFLEGWINGTRTQNVLVANPNGNIGFGIQEPTAKVHINTATAGTGFRLVDGSQGIGKVLVSDSNGNAHWETGQNSQYQKLVAVYTGNIQMKKANEAPNYTQLSGLQFIAQSTGRYFLNLHLFVRADDNASTKTFYFKVFENGTEIANPEVYTYAAIPPGGNSGTNYVSYTLPVLVYINAGSTVTFGFTDGLADPTPVTLTFPDPSTPLFAGRNNIEVVYLGK